MRKRHKIDPAQERLIHDIIWFIDAACADRIPIRETGTQMRLTETFIAVENRVPVDYGKSYPLPVVYTTALGATQLRYIRQMASSQSMLPANIRQVLENPKTRIVTDRPENLVYVSPHEASLLCSWGLPVIAWAPSERPTFWARPEDMQPIMTLRILHRESAGETS